MLTQILVVWQEKDVTHTAATSSKAGGERIAKAVSDHIKGECFCIIRECPNGENYNTKEFQIWRSGLRMQ